MYARAAGVSTPNCSWRWSAGPPVSGPGPLPPRCRGPSARCRESRLRHPTCQPSRQRPLNRTGSMEARVRLRADSGGYIRKHGRWRMDIADSYGDRLARRRGAHLLRALGIRRKPEPGVRPRSGQHQRRRRRRLTPTVRPTRLSPNLPPIPGPRTTRGTGGTRSPPTTTTIPTTPWTSTGPGCAPTPSNGPCGPAGAARRSVMTAQPAGLCRISDSTSPDRVAGKSSGTMPRPVQPDVPELSRNDWTCGLSRSALERTGSRAAVET